MHACRWALYSANHTTNCTGTPFVNWWMVPALDRTHQPNRTHQPWAQSCSPALGPVTLMLTSPGPSHPHAHQPRAPCGPHAHQPRAPCDPHAHQPCDPCAYAYLKFQIEHHRFPLLTRSLICLAGVPQLPDRAPSLPVDAPVQPPNHLAARQVALREAWRRVRLPALRGVHVGHIPQPLEGRMQPRACCTLCALHALYHVPCLWVTFLNL